MSSPRLVKTLERQLMSILSLPCSLSLFLPRLYCLRPFIHPKCKCHLVCKKHYMLGECFAGCCLCNWQRQFGWRKKITFLFTLIMLVCTAFKGTVHQRMKTNKQWKKNVINLLTLMLLQSCIIFFLPPEHGRRKLEECFPFFLCNYIEWELKLSCFKTDT